MPRRQLPPAKTTAGAMAPARSTITTLLSSARLLGDPAKYQVRNDA
jgi:hypothetical protein